MLQTRVHQYFYEICRLELVLRNPWNSTYIKKPTKCLSMKYVYSVVFVSVVEIKCLSCFGSTESFRAVSKWDKEDHLWKKLPIFNIGSSWRMTRKVDNFTKIHIIVYQSANFERDGKLKWKSFEGPKSRNFP